MVERGTFRKSTIKSGLKKRFRHRNPQLGNVGPDITISAVPTQQVRLGVPKGKTISLAMSYNL